MLCPKIHFLSLIDTLYMSSEDGKGVGRLTPEPPTRLADLQSLGQTSRGCNHDVWFWQMLVHGVGFAKISRSWVGRATAC